MPDREQNRDKPDSRRGKTVKRATLEEVQRASSRVIYSVASVFPFQLFPDSIEIHQNKVDIVYAYFFLSKSVFSLLLQDIRTVGVTMGPFFATLEFEVMGYEKNPDPVKFLPRQGAIEAKRIIMGLVAALHENVELGNYDVKTLREKAYKIGTTYEESV